MTNYKPTIIGAIIGAMINRLTKRIQCETCTHGQFVTRFIAVMWRKAMISVIKMAYVFIFI